MANDNTGFFRQALGYMVAGALWVASRVSGRIRRIEELVSGHGRTLSRHDERIKELEHFRDRTERDGLPERKSRSLGAGGEDSD